MDPRLLRGQAGRLLGVLLLEHGQPVSTTRLARWSITDPPPPNAAARLHVLVSRIRRNLLGTSGSLTITTVPGGYRGEVDPAAALDANVFEALLFATPDPGARRVNLRSALDLWRGDVLHDLGLAMHPAALRLAAERDDAWDEVFGLDVDHGDVLPNLAAAMQRSVASPEREGLAADVMRALHLVGRSRDALRHFQRISVALGQQFGLEPGDRLRRAERAVLDDEVPERPRAEHPILSTGNNSSTTASIPAAPAVPFVGRQAELEELRQALASYRLVTLWGPGGVGKTTLALRLAAECQATMPTWFVDLAAVTHGTDVAHAVARQTAINPEPHTPVEKAVVRHLAATDGLLLLDNCEHVLAPIARIAEQVVARSGRVRILATSRQPLDVMSEHTVPVGPMTPTDQLALLRSSLPASQRATVDERGLHEQLCRALDGVPLAIRLAAARLRTMTIDELITRLDDRFALLESPNTNPVRHRSLNDLLNWSHDLLDAEEQHLFSQLWIFVGTFDIEAVMQVCEDLDGRQTTQRPLARLVDKSLVQLAGGRGPTRYRLHESVRQYAGRRSRSTSTVERHARAYTDRLARLTAGRPGARELADAIEVDLPNYRAAMQFLFDDGDLERAGQMISSLTTFAELRPSMEVLSWATTYLTHCRNTPPTIHTIQAHLIAGVVCNYIAAWPASREHYRIAHDLDVQLEAGHTFSALVGLASPAGFLGLADESMTAADAAVEWATKSGRPLQQAVARCVRSWASLYAGRGDEIDLEELALYADTATSPTLRAYSLSAYACQLLARRSPVSASVLRTAAEAADRVGHVHMQCLHRSYLPFVEDASGEVGPLLGLRTALELYGGARLPFGPRQVAAETFAAFAAHRCWRTVAILSGAAVPRSIFSADARRAKRLARDELGSDAYNAAATRGRQLDHDTFARFLTDQLDELDVPAAG